METRAQKAACYAAESSHAVPADGDSKQKRSTVLSDLGNDLLSRIFTKLGPSPKHIVAPGAVCKNWRSVLKEVTWKELCFQIAGGLCDVLGYCGENIPPGGWRGLYKMLVYCPGLYPTLSTVIESVLLETQDEQP
jgi:hypothetical protein